MFHNVFRTGGYVRYALLDLLDLKKIKYIKEYTSKTFLERKNLIQLKIKRSDRLRKKL